MLYMETVYSETSTVPRNETLMIATLALNRLKMGFKTYLKKGYYR